MSWGVGGKTIYFLSSSELRPLRAQCICGDSFALMWQHVAATALNGSAASR